jgi:hypothetical protein
MTLMEPALILFLAGCTDDGITCRLISAMSTGTADRAQCEVMMDRALSAPDPAWPQLVAECVPDRGGLARSVPDWIDRDDGTLARLEAATS